MTEAFQKIDACLVDSEFPIFYWNSKFYYDVREEQPPDSIRKQINQDQTTIPYVLYPF